MQASLERWKGAKRGIFKTFDMIFLLRQKLRYLSRILVFKIWDEEEVKIRIFWIHQTNTIIISMGLKKSFHIFSPLECSNKIIYRFDVKNGEVFFFKDRHRTKERKWSLFGIILLKSGNLLLINSCWIGDKIEQWDDIISTSLQTTNERIRDLRRPTFYWMNHSRTNFSHSENCAIIYIFLL